MVFGKMIIKYLLRDLRIFHSSNMLYACDYDFHLNLLSILLDVGQKIVLCD